jgi:hypothetical protein
MLRIVTAFALIAVLATGCATAESSLSPSKPTSTPRSSPSTVSVASPSPTKSVSPAPTPPTGPLPLTAVAEKDGVRVRITLEHDPMPALALTRITTEVRNLGSDTLHWQSDGCATSVDISAEMTGSAWRPGVEQQDVAKQFKDYALDHVFRTDPLSPPSLRFVPPEMVDKGSYACADVGIDHEIAPGNTIEAVRVWDGAAGLRWGPPPTGAVTITGTFDSYWRGAKAPSPSRTGRLDVRLDAWVSGGADATWLSPPEVADAALADPAFAAYLATQRIGDGRSIILWYRPELDLWEVGVLAWHDAPTPQMHLVLVDPHSGAIVQTVDRRWDEDLDGSA